MATRTTVKVEGLRELGMAMRALGNDVARRIAVSMTSAAAKVVRDEAVLRAPESEEPHELEGVTVQPGNLKRNIVRKKLSARRTHLTSAHIVTVRGKKKDGYAARYGRLQEFGTVHHAPQPFLRPAFDAKKYQAVGVMRETARKRIEAAARKAARQAGAKAARGARK